MKLKPIKTKKDYQQALDRLELIFDAKKGTPFPSGVFAPENSKLYNQVFLYNCLVIAESEARLRVEKLVHLIAAQNPITHPKQLNEPTFSTAETVNLNWSNRHKCRILLAKFNDTKNSPYE